MTVDRALTASDVASLLHARRSGSGWMARCPAHQDRSPSLSIHEGEDGRVLLRCFSGCEFPEIAQALGARIGDLMGNAPRRDDDRRVPVPIRSLTEAEEDLGNLLLRELWAKAVEVRVVDHCRLLITPTSRVPDELMDRVRAHELLVIAALEVIDGVRIYSFPVAKRPGREGAAEARARLRGVV